MLRNLFTGTKGFQDSIARVDAAINAYNSALDDLELLTVMETRRTGKVISNTLEWISSSVQNIQHRLDSLPYDHSSLFLSVAHNKAR